MSELFVGPHKHLSHNTADPSSHRGSHVPQGWPQAPPTARNGGLAGADPGQALAQARDVSVALVLWAALRSQRAEATGPWPRVTR